MKKFLIGISIFVLFIATLYYWNESNKRGEQHPEINSAAGKPDDYLMEVMEYEGEHRHRKSAIKLEMAIESIWALEQGVDDESFERLELAVKKLENVHRRILRDSIPYDELMTSLEFVLGNLAHVELEVAAKYSASNQTSETRTALKYAQLHLKNILVLHNPNIDDESLILKSELKLLEEIDSLLSNKELSQAQYSEALDKMLKEVDLILEKIDED